MGSRAKLPSTKDLCLYLVEANGEDEDRICDDAINLVRQCIQDKIFSENQDQICVSRSDLDQEYEFDAPGWESLKRVEKTLRRPISGVGNTFETLMTAVQSLSVQATEDVYEKIKIVFFSNLRNCELKNDEMEDLREKLDTENIFFSLVLPDEVSRDDVQKRNAEIIKVALDSSEFVVLTTYEEAHCQIANTCTKKPVRPLPWNACMEIGNDIKINVGGYVGIRKNKVQELSKGYLKDVKSSIPSQGTSSTRLQLGAPEEATAQTAVATRESDSNGASVKEEVEAAKSIVQSDTTWKENDGTIVDEDNVGKGHFYGDKLIPFNELENNEAYKSGEKCLKILVFCPAEIIKPCYLLGDGTTEFYPKLGDRCSELLFNALVKSTHAAHKVAIARKVYRMDTKVSLGMLSPNIEKKCLTWVELCYSDDISIPEFPVLVNNEALEDDVLVEKDALIDELIASKSLPFPFNPSTGPVDPAVKTMRDNIACKILGEPTLAIRNQQQSGIDAYFNNLMKKNSHRAVADKLNVILPLKENVVDQERASGVNIFKKRELKVEETDHSEVKKIKVEETVVPPPDEDDDGLNADDLDSEKILYAFDFDHTIIHCNSDVEVMKIIDRPIPDDIAKVYNGKNWTEYMDQIFSFLASEGVTIDDIRDFTRKLTSTFGMEELIKKISETRQANPNSLKLMVISDANDFFIENYFDGVAIKPDCIITNPSEVTPEGRLRVLPYEHQIACKICPPNLCKGEALLKYLSEHGPFDTVVYTGDGKNDICPVSKLDESDFVFVRKGYGMEKQIQKGEISGEPVFIKAKLYFWENAETIQEVMGLK